MKRRVSLQSTTNRGVPRLPIVGELEYEGDAGLFSDSDGELIFHIKKVVEGDTFVKIISTQYEYLFNYEDKA